MEKILISACLFGQKVRYDGGNTLINDPIITKWQQEDRFIVLCPEVAAGLPIPRKPCEKDPKTDQIISADGEVFSEAFNQGASIALNLCKTHNIRFALLKERSPSCGVNLIYDGSFSSNKIPGSGVTAKLLKENAISVYSEFDLDQLKSDLAKA